MEKAKKTMEIQVKAFERIFKKVCELLDVERYDIIEIQSNIRVLDERVVRMSELNQLLMDQMLSLEDITAEMIDNEMQEWDELYQGYHKLKLRVDKLMQSNSSSSVSSESKKSRKLPVIEFRKFGGELKDWLSFWSQFRRIDEDADIENEDKFGYLLQSTIPNSRARQIVESYPQTAENYPKVIEGLKQRFGRKDLLVEVYVRELLKLILNNNSNKKTKLSTFYDKIESQLRALETLQVNSDTCAAMLYPLVESCLDEDLIRVWQRSSDFTEESTMKMRLDKLMAFLRKEVENEERIALAVSFESNQRQRGIHDRQGQREDKVETAADLVNSKPVLKCYFCSGDHFSENCTLATNWSIEKKRENIEGKCCYACLRFGHVSRRCRTRVTCKKCRGKHVTIMCTKEEEKKEVKQTKNNIVTEETEEMEQNLANQTYTGVFLQTMVVQLKGETGEKRRTARALIDTGSQRSYITKSAANEMGYRPIREEKLIHSLFGGTQTKTVDHKCYKIRLASVANDYACNFDVLDQPIICNNVVSVQQGPWFKELKKFDIEITDKNDGPIEILIGADVTGKLLTGKKQDLECGLVAVQTLLGWSLMGKVKNDENVEPSTSMLTTTLLVQDLSISKLWSLDVLGIKDPIEKMTSEKNEANVMSHFLTTVRRKSDGRYQVNMPWIEEHPPIPTNFYLAEKRLQSSVNKLRKDGYYQQYQEVFENWLKEDIIEKVEESTEKTKNYGHFLSHHPVYNFKSATTPIRPVFNASLKQLGEPSLNDCLEKRINMIELIPSVLLRFRLDRIGVTADIRKAFLQIELAETDREFVKFLWYDKDANLIVFRHTRVVFGINCSPFLLAAVLDLHLQNTKKGNLSRTYPTDVVEKLSKAFYVDNVLTSVKDKEALDSFVENSKEILGEGKFDLRGWESTILEKNDEDIEPNLTGVLGLIWNRNQDTLNLSLKWFENFETDKVTKRNILSAAHKLYDPIGFCCPVALIPKCLLQKLWSMNIAWDTEIDGEVKESFLKWLQEIPYIAMVEVPRWINPGCDKSLTSLHVFCDASEIAYSACIFLRS